MIGVVIVSYCSGDVIKACLDSLLASDHPDLTILICDNASPDNTLSEIRDWAERADCRYAERAESEAGQLVIGEPKSVSLIRCSHNLGFAGAVNVGLRALLDHQQIDLFWILNPDCEAKPGAASAYVRCAAGNDAFSLMGGRTLYLEPPQNIQSDGGRVGRWTGRCRNVNQGLSPADAGDVSAATLDFISGANMVASRKFIERAGLMKEDYFLYYEEVDWAARRGALPLRLCPEAEVLHHGGTAIGTGSVTRRASPFANYFNFRNRLMFMRRFHPEAVATAWVFSMLKIAQLIAKGAFAESWAAFAGLNGFPPPGTVRKRLGTSAPEFDGLKDSAE